MLKQRDRDTFEHPFPFPMDWHVGDLNSTAVDKDQDDSGVKAAPSTSQSNVSGVHTLSDSRTDDKIPLWKCFVRKSINNSRLFLTLLPSSFDDLLLLENIEVEDKRSESPSKLHESHEEKTISVNSGQSPSSLPSPGEVKSCTPQPQIGSVKPQGSVIQPQDGAVQSESSEQQIHDTEEQGHDEESESQHAAGESVECENSKEEDAGEVMKENEVPADVDTTQKHSELTHVIPVYVYECYYDSIIFALVHPWNFKLADDKFEDLTFEEVPAENEDMCPVRSPMFKRLSFEADKAVGVVGREEQYTPTHFMRLSQDRRSTENDDSLGDLKQQCSLLTESYYSCFVNGLCMLL